jgi:hypothetical protein
MKKLLYIAAAVVVMSIQANAQSALTNAQKDNARQIAAAKTNEMANDLGLSESQRSKINAINMKLALTDMDLNSTNGKIRDDRRADFINRQDKAYRGVLTPEQYNKWRQQK